MADITTIIPNALAALAALVMWGTALGMFFLSKWNLTIAGRSFLGVTVAFATLLTMSTVHLWLKDYPGIWGVRIFVYSFLVFAAVRVGWAVWKGILWGAPIDKGYTITFDDDREDVHVD